jgi:hypothetical protein
MSRILILAPILCLNSFHAAAARPCVHLTFPKHLCVQVFSTEYHPLMIVTDEKNHTLVWEYLEESPDPTSFSWMRFSLYNSSIKKLIIRTSEIDEITGLRYEIPGLEETSSLKILIPILIASQQIIQQNNSELLVKYQLNQFDPEKFKWNSLAEDKSRLKPTDITPYPWTQEELPKDLDSVKYPHQLMGILVLDSKPIPKDHSFCLNIEFDQSKSDLSVNTSDALTQIWIGNQIQILQPLSDFLEE